MGEETTPTAPADADEARLVERLVAGEEHAFAALVSKLGPGMLRLASSLLRDRGAAEEVVQETWVAALEGLASFERRSSLKTWLFRILVNRAKTRRARDARTVSLPSMDEPPEEDAPAVDPARFGADGHWSAPPVAWPGNTPERLVLLAESRAAISEALALLPERQRSVVVLRDVEGWSSEEVRAALDLTEANQRVLLHRGRSRMRAALEAYLSGAR